MIDPAAYEFLVTFPSGSRLGVHPPDETGGWDFALDSKDAAALVPLSSGRMGVLLELLETKRRDFEDDLLRAASEAGLDAEAMLRAFPSEPLVRAALETMAAPVVRLGLEWIAPSELRALREPIEAIAKSNLPRAVRDLAHYLLVPA